MGNLGQIFGGLCDKGERMHKRVESGSARHLQGKDHLDEGLRCRGPTLRDPSEQCAGAQGPSHAIFCPHRTRLHTQPLSAAWLQMDLGARVVRPGPPIIHWAVVPQSPGFSPLQGAGQGPAGVVATPGSVLTRAAPPPLKGWGPGKGLGGREGGTRWGKCRK